MRDFKKSDILLVSSGIQKDNLTKPDLLIIGYRTHRTSLPVNTNIYFANNYTNTKEQIVYKKQIQRNERLYFLLKNFQERIEGFIPKPSIRKLLVNKTFGKPVRSSSDASLRTQNLSSIVSYDLMLNAI